MKTSAPKKQARRRALSLVIIAAAVVGFVANSAMRHLHRITTTRLNRTTVEPIVVPLSPLSEHRVEFWAVDEELGYPWASVSARFSVRDGNGTRLVERSLNATASEAEGGVKRASIGDSVHVPPGPTELRIALVLEQGDYVDLAVYRDLSDWLNVAPGIYVLLGLGGFVLFLKSRAVA